MGIFENIKEVDGKIMDTGWVQWRHFLIPNYPDWLRLFMRILAVISRHCLICTALSGCYFKNNKHPEYPHHDFCDCLLVDLKSKQNKFSAYCDIAKFTNYIFSDKYQNGKRTLFEDLGYNENDSYALKEEFERQAAEAYSKGEYSLHNLDIYGQNINIDIYLSGNGKFYCLKSGWKVYPEGYIVCNTPYGGR